jgi:hypothetical protein
MMRDYDRLASLFTRDGAVRIPDINAEAVSREEIRAGIERLQADHPRRDQAGHRGLRTDRRRERSAGQLPGRLRGQCHDQSQGLGRELERRDRVLVSEKVTLEFDVAAIRQS